MTRPNDSTASAGVIKIKSFAKFDSISAEELKERLLAPSVDKFEKTMAALTGAQRPRSSFYPQADNPATPTETASGEKAVDMTAQKQQGLAPTSLNFIVLAFD